MHGRFVRDEGQIPFVFMLCKSYQNTPNIFFDHAYHRHVVRTKLALFNHERRIRRCCWGAFVFVFEESPC